MPLLVGTRRAVLTPPVIADSGIAEPSLLNFPTSPQTVTGDNLLDLSAASIVYAGNPADPIDWEAVSDIDGVVSSVLAEIAESITSALASHSKDVGLTIGDHELTFHTRRTGQVPWADTETIDVSVQPDVDIEAPTVSVPWDDTKVFSVAANTSLVITGAGVASITLTVAHGVLNLAGTSGLTGSGNGTASLTYSGTVANLNTALDGLIYTPASTYAGADTLTVASGATVLGEVGITVTEWTWLESYEAGVQNYEDEAGTDPAETGDPVKNVGSGGSGGTAATQSVTGESPQLSAGPKWSFATDDSLNIPYLSAINNAAKVTWLFKFNKPKLSANGTFFSKLASGDYGNDFLIALFGSDLTIQIDNGADGGATSDLDGIYTPTEDSILAIVFNGTLSGDANRLKAFLDGVQLTLDFTGYTVPATTANVPSTRQTIGCYDNPGGTTNFTGDIYFVKIKNDAASDVQAEFITTP